LPASIPARAHFFSKKHLGENRQEGFGKISLQGCGEGAIRIRIFFVEIICQARGMQKLAELAALLLNKIREDVYKFFTSI
jgi:hypothetical protein